MKLLMNSNLKGKKKRKAKKKIRKAKKKKTEIK